MIKNLRNRYKVWEKKRHLIWSVHSRDLRSVDKKFKKGLINKEQWQKERIILAGNIGKKSAEADEAVEQAQLAYFNSDEYKNGEYKEDLKAMHKNMLPIQRVLKKTEKFSNDATLTFYYHKSTEECRLGSFRRDAKERIELYKKKPGTYDPADIYMLRYFLNRKFFKARLKLTVEEDL